MLGKIEKIRKLEINIRHPENWRDILKTRHIPQNCYVELHPGKEPPSLEVVFSASNIIEADVFHDRVITWEITPMQDPYTHELLLTIADLCSKLLKEHSLDWDGSNWVGFLTEKGREIKEEIKEIVDSYCTDVELQYGEIDADKWYSEEEIEVPNITGMDEEDLASLILEIETDAIRDGYLIIGLEEFLRRYNAEKSL